MSGASRLERVQALAEQRFGKDVRVVIGRKGSGPESVVQAMVVGPGSSLLLAGTEIHYDAELMEDAEAVNAWPPDLDDGALAELEAALSP